MLFAYTDIYSSSSRVYSSSTQLAMCPGQGDLMVPAARPPHSWVFPDHTALHPELLYLGAIRAQGKAGG